MPKFITIVEWDDAWQDQENFTTAHGIRATHEAMPIETFGMLLHDDEVGVSLANERSTQDGHDVYRGRTFVPRAMVKSVTTYKLVKVRTPKPSPETEKPQEV